MDVPDNTNRTILIAEDVDSNFQLLKAILSKTYTLLHAKNGEEAVSLFLQYSPDLTLMDMRMPLMNGLEASAKIRTFNKDIPIIALTAFAFDHDHKNMLNAGCNDILTKPLSRKSLLEMLEKYLVL